MPESRQKVRTAKDLIVWQTAIDLVKDIYRLTDEYPKREWYGLSAQMRRAAVSIPANIAEDRGRYTTREYLRFLRIATGSLRELETYFELSLRLGFATIEQLQSLTALTDQIGAMLIGLCASLKRVHSTTGG